MAEKHISAKIKSYFSAAVNRQNLTSGEEIQTSFGKIAKWLGDLKTVAFTGSYNDLSNKPTIPTVNNGTLTIQQNGTTKATFTANQSTNSTANIDTTDKLSLTGGTMTGALTDTARIIAKSTNIDRDGDNPTAQVNGNEFRLTDKNDLAVGGMYPLQETNGAIRNVIYSRSGSHYNILNVITDKDGTFRYSVSSPSAFRSAIGLDPLGYYGICGRTTNTSTNPWVLVAETTATTSSNNTGITLLFDYTYTSANNATSTGTGILTVSVRTDANGAIVTDRSYAKWLTKTNELNNDDVVVTYTNSTKSLQIWGKSDYPYKVMRIRPLSGGRVFNTFDVSAWTFTTALNTNMYASYPTGDGITVLTPTCDMQEQINYNTNNGVKNLISTKWFIEGSYSTIESRNDKTGSLTGSAPASASAAYIQTYIPEDVVNSILENGKTYILSWNVDSRTNDGIFGIRKTTGVYHSSSTLNRTGSYSVSYTHDSSVPVYISLCINTSATSADKRIALSNVMLREATIEDATFEPYAEPNSRLTQKVDKALEQTGYNLLKLTTQTVTTNNVTFSADGKAGTITVTRSGTQTANAYFTFNLPNTIYGKMCLSGCADGGNADTYSVYPWDATTGARPKNWEGTANAEASISASDYVEVNYVQGHTNTVAIRITPTASFTSLTFKPMIVPEALAGIPFQPYAKSNVELTQDLDGKAPLTSNNSIDFVSSGVTWNDSSSNTYDRLSTYASGNKTAWLVSSPTYDVGIGLAADGSKAWVEAWVDYPSNKSNGLIEFYDTYIDIRKDDNTEPILRLSKSPSTVDSKWNHGNKSITLKNNGITFDNITIPYANNAGFHNSIYRGKNLGTSYTSAQKAQVQAGTFDDLFVGDYWLINNIHWRIGHCDYYLNTGLASPAHHLVIVPDEALGTSPMNTTGVTTGAYAGSYMYTTTLLQDGTEASSSVFGKIKAAFGEDNLLSIYQLFTNAVDNNGNVSGWSMYNTRCFLMNQCMVCGQKVWSNGNNDGYNVGIDKTQLALFSHDTSAINIRLMYWLRDVYNSTKFVRIDGNGYVDSSAASNVHSVRPVFLLS